MKFLGLPVAYLQEHYTNRPLSYVSKKTTIPIPRVHAWSLSEGSPLKLPYIIMDYVEGKTLSQLGFPDDPKWKTPGPGKYGTSLKAHIYRQIGGVYAQLRGLEFPEVGALGINRQASSPSTRPSMSHEINESGFQGTSSGTGLVGIDSITIRHRPMPVELALQEVEGREPSQFFPPETTFQTAREYTNALISLAMNNIDKATDNHLDNGADPRLYIYGYYDFQRFVVEEWLDDSLDQGPFVLMHGDLSFHAGNLLWDENHKLLAVLDWERSYTVPLQHFVPPLWLVGFYGVFGLVKERCSWMEEAQLLRRRTSLHERAHRLQPKLSAEWEEREFFPHVIIALALLRPETVDDAYWGFLAMCIGGVDPDFSETLSGRTPEDFKEFMHARVDSFFRDRPSAEALVARKVEEQKAFDEKWAKHREDTPECRCIGCKHDKPSSSV